jgi:hypothetical protein
MPSDHTQLDRQGGVVPTARDRAKKAELVTLPADVPGKNCGTCVYGQLNPKDEIGPCKHPQVMMLVSARQGCKFWTHPGVIKY